MATIDGFKAMFPMWSHICRSLGCRVISKMKIQPRLYVAGVAFPYLPIKAGFLG